jgi:histidinol-phosphate aminotransferase
VVGNGSDELLALAVRAFVETRDARIDGARKLVQYLEPSYSLYPILANIHGARRNPVALRPDFGLPTSRELAARGWDTRAALTFVTTPNAPSGRGYSCRELERLCGRVEGVVVLDEAYVDFGTESALELAFRYPHVLVARTFSKAYSLCFQRVGYFVGHPRLIRAIDAIRDSYNVNGLGQTAALATLDDLPYYRRNFRRLIAARRKATYALGRLGFQVFPSETNFLFARPPDAPASRWFELFRERGILVRWFSSPVLREFMRITIGTEQEMKALVDAARRIRKDLRR